MNQKDERLEQALMPNGPWNNIQDCAEMTQPTGGRPAREEKEWRRWPQPSPIWLVEAVRRARLSRN